MTDKQWPLYRGLMRNRQGRLLFDNGRQVNHIGKQKSVIDMDQVKEVLRIVEELKRYGIKPHEYCHGVGPQDRRIEVKP